MKVLNLGCPKGQGMVVSTFLPSTQEEFQAILVYSVSSRTDRAVTQRNPVSKLQPPPKNSPKGIILIIALMEQEKKPCSPNGKDLDCIYLLCISA